VDILTSFQNVKTLRKCNAPYWKRSGDRSGLNLTSFRAMVSLRSTILAVWKIN